MASPPQHKTLAPQSALLVGGTRLLSSEERKACVRTLRRVFRAANLQGFDIGLALVHDLEMRALHRKFKGQDKSTDVLSFPAHAGGDIFPGSEHIVGDVVICVDAARRQARAGRPTVAEELAILLAHGICHLSGLDHETGSAHAEVQAACEATLLAYAGIDPRVGLVLRTQTTT